MPGNQMYFTNKIELSPYTQKNRLAEISRNYICTYHIPTISRVMSSITLDTEKLEITENTNPVTSENRRTFTRPQVSARKPQKWDVITTPMNPMALITPCSAVVISISHFAAGNTNAIFSASITTPSRENPVANKMKK